MEEETEKYIRELTSREQLNATFVVRDLPSAANVVPSSVYIVNVDGKRDVELYLQTKPGGVQTVKNIQARDELNPSADIEVLVEDATTDPTIAYGAVVYNYDWYNETWTKTHEFGQWNTTRAVVYVSDPEGTLYRVCNGHQEASIGMMALHVKTIIENDPILGDLLLLDDDKKPLIDVTEGKFWFNNHDKIRLKPQAIVLLYFYMTIIIAEESSAELTLEVPYITEDAATIAMADGKGLIDISEKGMTMDGEHTLKSLQGTIYKWMHVHNKSWFAFKDNRDRPLTLQMILEEPEA